MTCPICGIDGLHACIGRFLEPPTDEDYRRLDEVLNKYATPKPFAVADVVKLLYNIHVMGRHPDPIYKKGSEGVVLAIGLFIRGQPAIEVDFGDRKEVLLAGYLESIVSPQDTKLPIDQVVILEDIDSLCEIRTGF